MISIVITSFNEPSTIGKAIDSFTDQIFNEDYELFVCAPDLETLCIAKTRGKKNKKIKIFRDPGKGKSFALNLLLPKLRGRIIILSDGDVFVSDNSISNILKKFSEDKIGCVSGKPVPINPRSNLFGYWAHLMCYAADKLRKKRDNSENFLECSGYLWAFRNKIIKKFPLDIGEDTIVPILFFLKEYRVRYSSESAVFVKFPSNFKDFLKQKKRAAAAHDNFSKYTNIKKIPRMKTFFNEVIGGFSLLLFPKNIKEIFWTFLLYPVRLYIWMSLFYSSKIKKLKYSDAWKRIESTK